MKIHDFCSSILSRVEKNLRPHFDSIVHDLAIDDSDMHSHRVKKTKTEIVFVKFPVFEVEVTKKIKHLDTATATRIAVSISRQTIDISRVYCLGFPRNSHKRKLCSVGRARIGDGLHIHQEEKFSLISKIGPKNNGLVLCSFWMNFGVFFIDRKTDAFYPESRIENYSSRAVSQAIVKLVASQALTALVNNLSFGSLLKRGYDQSMVGDTLKFPDSH